MKRKIFISSLIILAIINFSAIVLSFTLPQDPEDLEGIARVKKRQGIEIYVMSEPVRDYEIVGEVEAVDAAGIINFLAGEEEQQSIVEQVDILLTNAKRKVRKGKMEEFDALMTDEGDIGQLIKFTD